MSSVKKLNMCRSEKCNDNVGHGSDDSRVTTKRPNMPPILRLDSTGEVTSHDFGGNRPRGCDRTCQFSKKMNKSFKNIVDYVGAASSSFIDVGTGISKHLTDNRNPLDCVKKMLHVNGTPFDVSKSEHMMADIVEKEAMPYPRGSPAVGTGQSDAYPFFKNWSNSVLGAFHGNGYKSPWHSFHKQAYYNGYSPYHRRPDFWQSKKNENFSDIDTGNTIDPNLKPYNARLLQKSKQCKKNNPINNPTSQHGNSIIGADKQVKITESDVRKSDSPKIKHQETGSLNSNVTDDSAQTSAKIHIASENDILSIGNGSSDRSSKPLNSAVQVNDCIAAENITAENIQNAIQENLQNGIQESHSEEKRSSDNEKVTDWFEYENKDLKTIPIDLHTIETKCETTHTSPEIDAAFVQPSLHSWFSIDFDAESVKCKSENLTKDQPQSVDRGQNDREQLKNESDISQSKEDACDIKKINVKIENLDTSPKSKSNHADIKDASESDKSFILYVRNLKKSSKPSCKKRRRQRAKKECKIVEKSGANPAAEKTVTESDCKGKENPIAFILGIDAQAYSAGKAQPFLVSCDINSDSDWSDSENECDESPEESIPDELSMFALCDNFNPLNFKVTCSVQSSPTESSSRIDSVNLSWQVNVCVSTATQDRKRNDKKVHFASEEDLVVVHPVSQTTEWCEAYEEARKGPWVQYAADRERFRKRITDSETVLNPILLDSHRERVYSDRFCEN